MRKMRSVVMMVAVLLLSAGTIVMAGVKEAEELVSQKKYVEAEAEYRKCLPELKGEEKENAQGRIVTILWWQGKKQEAIVEAQSLLNTEGIGEKVKAHAYYITGLSYWRMKDYEKAIDAFQKNRNSKYPNADACNRWGTCLEEQGKYEEAIERYKDVMSIAKNTPQEGYWTSYMSYNIGTCLEKLGNKEEAQKYFIAGCQAEGASLDHLKLNFNKVSKAKLGIEGYKTLVKNLIFIIPAVPENVDFLSTLKSELKKLEE